jgi:hypothetical protein
VPVALPRIYSPIHVTYPDFTPAARNRTRRLWESTRYTVVFFLRFLETSLWSIRPSRAYNRTTAQSTQSTGEKFGFYCPGSRPS